MTPRMEEGATAYRTKVKRAEQYSRSIRAATRRYSTVFAPKRVALMARRSKQELSRTHRVIFMALPERAAHQIMASYSNWIQMVTRQCSTRFLSLPMAQYRTRRLFKILT